MEGMQKEPGAPFTAEGGGKKRLRFVYYLFLIASLYHGTTYMK